MGLGGFIGLSVQAEFLNRSRRHNEFLGISFATQLTLYFHEGRFLDFLALLIKKWNIIIHPHYRAGIGSDGSPGG